ncbi:magnesium transporter [Methanomicrobium sp. W14]|uniref:magnesium transporter n=1 Tax=Methanomicrobium sp. W14 TaxID=2817839 RepID=UPI001AE8DB62|nr:magnesium transporter [Methanomicrobium sp. W14]
MMKFQAVDGYQLRLFITGLFALLISATAAIAAGIYLGSVSDVLAYLPSLMVLVPPSINMRGSISGVLASRLSSSMHLGEFEINFSKNSLLGLNTRVSLYISIFIAFALGIIAYVISSFFGINGINPWDYLVISVFSGVLSSLIVMGFALVVIISSYNRGVDLDMVGSPSVTTAADLITIPILVLTALFVLGLSQEVRYILLVPVIFFFALSVYSSFLSGNEKKSISKEIVTLLVPLSVLCTFAGVTYASDIDKLVDFAVFLVLIPPFTGGCGSIGGILCSRLATGMHTGELSPHIFPGKGTGWYFASTYLYACIIMPFLAVVANSCAIYLGMSTPGFYEVLITCLVAGMIVITFVNLVGYITASVSFRRGFDPDNFGVPVITSFIDLAGATVLVTIINLIT